MYEKRQNPQEANALSQGLPFMPFLTYCILEKRRQMRSSKVFFHVHGHSSWNTHQTFHYIYSRSLIVAGLNWKGRAYIQTNIRALERQSGSLNYVFYIDKGTITCCELFIGYVCCRKAHMAAKSHDTIYI